MKEFPAFNVPPNPQYGDGNFVRSMLIKSPRTNAVSLAMEDVHHAFELWFEHDGKAITAMDASWDRHPMSGCQGATDALKELVGCPLGGNLVDVIRFTDRRQHCTHLFDMLCFAIVHAWHQREDRRYDVIAPDARQGRQEVSLNVNGEPVLQLVLADHEFIVKPGKYQDTSYLRGFVNWARANLPPLELEHALIIQRALFVSQSRRMDFSSTIGKPASLSGPPAGVCFMAQPGRYEASYRLDTMRDLSNAAPDDLLRFADQKPK